jgi:hypothetical protein
VATRWKRPSAAGRRLALERKFGANVAHYGGAVSLLTLTPPGQDLLPWGDEVRLVSGIVGELNAEWSRLVEYPYREVWNRTAQARASRLFEAAQRAADRFVKRQWGGDLPRQIGNVRSEQKRGVWHFHWLLPMGSEVERAWSRCVRRYFEKAWKNELARWSAEERWAMLWAEYAGESVPKGFYGFGFVDRKSSRHAAAGSRAARYMGRNAAGYMARNVAGVGRHYVSARLIRETGVTMRALRACNWLYVRRKLIASGELDDEWIPSYWTPEWTAQVLAVRAVVDPLRGPP